MKMIVGTLNPRLSEPCSPNDRGERLAKAGIGPSVSNRGDSYDNVLAETTNGFYKAELIHRPVTGS